MAGGSEQLDILVPLMISVSCTEMINDCVPWILDRLFPGSLSTRSQPGARDRACSPAYFSGISGWSDRDVDREDVPGLTHAHQALLGDFGSEGIKGKPQFLE